jgi:hypothetical protein
MPSGFSETQIFNAVLDRLSEESVLSTTDEKAVARWLNRNYPLQRDVLLQRHTWNFALKRQMLAADTARPAFEWQWQYQVPDDSLRITNSGSFSPIFIDLLSQVLAANFAYWLTGKATFSKQLLDVANVSYLEAARIDSLEGLPEEPDDNDLIMVR